MEIIRLYQKLFSRKIFYPFNKKLHALALRGMGILDVCDVHYNGEAVVLQSILADQSTGAIFDVGANIGDYIKLIRDYNQTIAIHAFEPHPKTYAVLLQATNNLQIVTNNCALAELSGSLELYDYADSRTGSDHASLYREVIEDLHSASAQALVVPVLTVDDYCQAHHIDQIKFIKIDTEGSELKVLRGATHMLQTGRIKYIQFEFNHMNIISHSFLRDFYELLSAYDIYRVLRDGLVLVPYQETMEIFAYQNFLAIKK